MVALTGGGEGARRAPTSGSVCSVTVSARPGDAASRCFFPGRAGTRAGGRRGQGPERRHPRVGGAGRAQDTSVAPRKLNK